MDQGYRNARVATMSRKLMERSSCTLSISVMINVLQNVKLVSSATTTTTNAKLANWVVLVVNSMPATVTNAKNKSLLITTFH